MFCNLSRCNRIETTPVVSGNGVVNFLHSGNLWLENKWNADATTIIVGDTMFDSFLTTIADGNKKPLYRHQQYQMILMYR